MGGGEKVLYKMVEAMLANRADIQKTIKREFQIAIYSAAKASPREIVQGVKVS